MAAARPVPDLGQDTVYRDAAVRTVRVRAQELFDHLEGVLDTSDIERVHAARVATRRLRAVLEVFAPCFPKKLHRRVLKDVKRLADALGERRDPDVQLDWLATVEHAVPGPDRAGIASLQAHFRDAQEQGNIVLVAELARIAERDLRGHLAELTGDRTPAPLDAAPPEPAEPDTETLRDPATPIEEPAA